MNKLYVIFLISLSPFVLFAQKKKQDFKFQEVSNVKVDGEIADWDGKLYNPDSELWSFALSKIGDKFCVAVRVKDEMLQREALRNGIFVNLSLNDKKKEGARLIYPYVDRERLRALSQDEDRQATNFKKDLLESVRGYKITGFSKVVDGILSFENTYGIQAVARIDESGALIYESEIPLDLIKFKENRIAVQIGINTQYSQMRKVVDSSSRPQNVRIYGMSTAGPTVKNPYKEETAVWIFGDIK